MTPGDKPVIDPVVQVLSQAKKLAKEYRRLTGKPLGITGEVAEYEAWRILGVELASARSPGFDAIETVNGATRRLQVKGRCVLNRKPGQRVGRIDLTKEWDAVLLVLLDEDLEATAIYEADREAVVAALTAPGSRARNERGALAVAKFRAIGVERWRRHAIEGTSSRDALISRETNSHADRRVTIGSHLPDDG